MEEESDDKQSHWLFDSFYTWASPGYYTSYYPGFTSCTSTIKGISKNVNCIGVIGVWQRSENILSRFLYYYFIIIIVLFHILQDRAVVFWVPRKLRLKSSIHFIHLVKLPVSINTFC